MQEKLGLHVLEHQEFRRMHIYICKRQEKLLIDLLDFRYF
jgi:hypothetical protein